MKIKTNIKTLREAKGYNQQQMAQLLGYTLTSYNKVEKGHRQMSTKKAKIAAVILECSMDEFFLPSCFPKRTNDDEFSCF